MHTRPTPFHMLLFALQQSVDLSANYSFSGSAGSVNIVPGVVDSDALAYTIFQDFNESAARYHLLVQTKPGATNEQQMYFAGFAEGYATAELMKMHLLNIQFDMNQGENYSWNPIYTAYAQTNMEYIKSNAGNASFNYPRLVVEQWIEGMVAGANKKLGEDVFTQVDIFLMNTQGDLEDIEGLYEETRERYNWKIEQGQWHHCTGSVRHSPELDDVWFSQDTWTSFYSGFIRLAKTYSFNLHMGFTTQQRVTFSSLPGYFFSIDDFYVVYNSNGSSKTNLAILETTYHTFNEELFALMDKYGNQSVLTWMRCQLSNLQSMRPQQWSEYFGTLPSWTYNNNYLFLDYNAVEKVKNAATDYHSRYQYIQDNKIELLHTLEIVPGHPKFWDATQTFLDQKMYISINVPTDEELLNVSGYTAKDDPYWSYNGSSRYCISTRDLPAVSTYAEFKEYVRYNDYKHDPCSNNDPGQSISSRYDQRDPKLTDRTASLMGATDSKCTNLELAKEMMFDFVVGPISGGKSKIPPFNFASRGSDFAPNWERQPLGYFDVFPNVWMQTAGYACVQNQSACVHGSCNFGSCVCADYFIGAQCDRCPPNFDSTCTHCQNGYSLKSGECAYTANDLAVGLAIGIPTAVLCIALGVWAYFFYRQGGVKRQVDGYKEIDANESGDDTGVVVDDEKA